MKSVIIPFVTSGRLRASSARHLTAQLSTSAPASSCLWLIHLNVQPQFGRIQTKQNCGAVLVTSDRTHTQRGYVHFPVISNQPKTLAGMLNYSKSLCFSCLFTSVLKISSFILSGFINLMPQQEDFQVLFSIHLYMP